MSDQELAQIIWDYMRFEQLLEKADLILGLGNHDIRTAEWAAKLWSDKWAPKILFTGDRGKITKATNEIAEAEEFASKAVMLGVPNTSILRETKATNTSENFLYSYRMLESESIPQKSIIIVTKPYMLRRAYATFMKQWPAETKPQVIMSAIDLTFEQYCNGQYSFDYIVNVMVGDLQRIMEYPKLGFQIEQNVPDEVKQAFNELVKRGYDKHLL